MNSKKKDILKISEHGIITEQAMRAYLRDELSSVQRAEFEKLLKNDPFAQDALDGLRETNRDVLAGTIISLNRKVRERIGIREKKVFQIHWTNYAMAAALLGLLIGIGFVLMNYFGETK